MTRVLGVDASLSCTGVALVADEPTSHVARAVVPPKGLVGLRRAIWIVDHVMELVALTNPTHVAIEGYSFAAKGNAIYQLGELGGILRYNLALHGMPYTEVPPGKWRKDLFGKGSLAKDAVRLEAWKRYGIEYENLDVLEAHCVALSVLRERQGLNAPEPIRRRKGVAG